MGSVVNNSIIDISHFWNTETAQSSLTSSENITLQILRSAQGLGRLVVQGMKSSEVEALGLDWVTQLSSMDMASIFSKP